MIPIWKSNQEWVKFIIIKYKLYSDGLNLYKHFCQFIHFSKHLNVATKATFPAANCLQQYKDKKYFFNAKESVAPNDGI